MKKLVVIAASLMLFGCSYISGLTMETADDYPTLVKEAKASIDKAKSIGGEWRDSKKLLKKAAKAEKAGKTDKAKSLAKKARFQGEMGYEQALGQKDAGPWLF